MLIRRSLQKTSPPAAPALQANAPAAIEQILQPELLVGEGKEIKMTINPTKALTTPRAARPSRNELGSFVVRLRSRLSSLSMHGAKGGAPAGNRNGNYRHGMGTKEAALATKYINLLSRFTRRS